MLTSCLQCKQIDSEDVDVFDDDEVSSVESVVAQIDRCLRHRLRTRLKLKITFNRFADDEDDYGRPALSEERAREMLPDVCSALRLPGWVFQDLPLLFRRFDFSGRGLLDERACAKMYKSALKQWRVQLAGRKWEIEVPESTLEEAGYTVVTELGRGGQGTMYLCTKRFSWRNFCVKFYDKKNATATGIEEVVDEYALMKELNCSYVAKTYEIFQDRSFYYLVNEPYTGGDLTKLGKRAVDAGVDMSENWWRGILKQCMDGVNYLHKHAIIHCDIKEPNIMIADGRSYKAPRPVLIDFGLSTVFGSHARQVCGTPGYIPPETWLEAAWFPKGDVFSLGITFFQMVTGKVPQMGFLGVLQAKSLSECASLAKTQQLPWAIFPKAMPLLAQLLEKLTERDIERRPLCPGALEHKWFSSKSDAPLPDASIRGLLGRAADQEALEAVVGALVEANNLNDLRALETEFAVADPFSLGWVSLHIFQKLLLQRKVPADIAEGYARCNASRQVDYLKPMRAAVDWKMDYNQQYALERFDSIDIENTGMIHIEDIRELLESIEFQCERDDIHELIAQMHPTREGFVAREQFRDVILRDGRIAQRGSNHMGISIWEQLLPLQFQSRP